MDNQWVVAGLLSIAISIVGRIVFDWLNTKHVQKLDTTTIHCPMNHSGTINKIDEINRDTEKTKDKIIVLEVHTKNMVEEQKTTNKLLRDLNNNLNH